MFLIYSIMKYSKEITDRICAQIAQGEMIKNACKMVGVSTTTFCEWQNTKPEFAEAVKKAKQDFNDTIVGRLEASLWKKATGYEAEETKTTFGKDAEGNPQIVKQEKIKKHFSPDTAALIFALTNLAPDKWVNHQRVDTKVVDTEVGPNYAFADLPKDVLFDIADKLQEAAFEKEKEE